MGESSEIGVGEIRNSDPAECKAGSNMLIRQAIRIDWSKDNWMFKSNYFNEIIQTNPTYNFGAI